MNPQSTRWNGATKIILNEFDDFNVACTFRDTKWISNYKKNLHERHLKNLCFQSAMTENINYMKCELCPSKFHTTIAMRNHRLVHFPKVPAADFSDKPNQQSSEEENVQNKKYTSDSVDIAGKADKKNLEIARTPGNVKNPEIARNPENLKNLEIAKNLESASHPDNVRNPENLSNPDNVKNLKNARNPENLKDLEIAKGLENAGHPENVSNPDNVQNLNNVSNPDNVQDLNNATNAENGSNSKRSRSAKNGRNSENLNNSEKAGNSKISENSKSVKNPENAKNPESEKNRENAKNPESEKNRENAKNPKISENPKSENNPENAKNPKILENLNSETNPENAKNPKISENFSSEKNPENAKNPKSEKNREDAKNPESERNPENAKNPKISENLSSEKNPENAKNPKSEKNREDAKNPESENNRENAKNPKISENPKSEMNPENAKNPKISENLSSEKNPENAKNPKSEKNREDAKNPESEKNPENAKNPKISENLSSETNPENAKNPEREKNRENAKNPKISENPKSEKNPENAKNPENGKNLETARSLDNIKRSKNVKHSKSTKNSGSRKNTDNVKDPENINNPGGHTKHREKTINTENATNPEKAKKEVKDFSKTDSKSNSKHATSSAEKSHHLSSKSKSKPRKENSNSLSSAKNKSEVPLVKEKKPSNTHLSDDDHPRSEVAKKEIPKTTATYNKCPLCSQYCKNRNHLNTHILTRHPNSKRFVCLQCLERFNDLLDLQMHLCDAHMEARLNSKTFLNTSHPGSEDNEPEYLLEVPKPKTETIADNESFPAKQMRSLSEFKKYLDETKHLQTVRRQKPFECTMCGRRFAEASKLSIHAFAHSESFSVPGQTAPAFDDFARNTETKVEYGDTFLKKFYKLLKGKGKGKKPVCKTHSKRTAKKLKPRENTAEASNPAEDIIKILCDKIHYSDEGETAKKKKKTDIAEAGNFENEVMWSAVEIHYDNDENFFSDCINFLEYEGNVLFQKLLASEGFGDATMAIVDTAKPMQVQQNAIIYGGVPQRSASATTVKQYQPDSVSQLWNNLTSGAIAEDSIEATIFDDLSLSDDDDGYDAEFMDLYFEPFIIKPYDGDNYNSDA